MATRAAVGEPDLPSPSRCWCCGRTERAEGMVRLGHHPEVALCPGCARWAAKQAAEIEDRGRTGPRVTARRRLRAVRRRVVERGWHRSRLVGRPIRWLGKRLP